MVSEAQKRAIKKWREKNREKIAAHRRERYATDAEYRERQQKRSLEYYRGLDEETKKRLHELQRTRYGNDEQYRERVKQKSRDWYYKNKHKGDENV